MLLPLTVIDFPKLLCVLGSEQKLFFLDGRNIYINCTKILQPEILPEYILVYSGLSSDHLIPNPLLVLDFIGVKRIADLV